MARRSAPHVGYTCVPRDEATPKGGSSGIDVGCGVGLAVRKVRQVVCHGRPSLVIGGPLGPRAGREPSVPSAGRGRFACCILPEPSKRQKDGRQNKSLIAAHG